MSIRRPSDPIKDLCVSNLEVGNIHSDLVSMQTVYHAMLYKLSATVDGYTHRDQSRPGRLSSYSRTPSVWIELNILNTGVLGVSDRCCTLYQSLCVKGAQMCISYIDALYSTLVDVLFGSGDPRRKGRVHDIYASVSGCNHVPDRVCWSVVGFLDMAALVGAVITAPIFHSLLALGELACVHKDFNVQDISNMTTDHKAMLLGLLVYGATGTCPSPVHVHRARPYKRRTHKSPPAKMSGSFYICPARRPGWGQGVVSMHRRWPVE